MRSTLADRALALWLVVGGAVGFLAAAVLLVERIRLAEDPSYVPSCSINPVLSCGSIMTSDQASLLGFPNPVIGVAAFPVVASTGAALLAGAALARWYWWGLQAGATAGLALVVWLIHQSLYEIGALCPYCMVVWAVVLPTAWFVTVRNLRAGVFGSGLASAGPTRAIVAWQAPILLVAFLVVLTLIAQRFWSYWSTLL